ncbi:MAG: ABC transporter ATP-binding protein [Candidatus Hermodarchaeota archaeon]
MVHLKKSYGVINAVDDLSLEIKDGEYIAFLGPTGAGKTTTMYLITGIVYPDSGEIIIDGKNITQIPPEDRGIGFVFEQFALFPHLNLIENCTYSRWVRGQMNTLTGRGQALEIANEMLEMIFLTGRNTARVNELSGGMKQRLALARGLCMGAQIIVMDEPLGALDAKIRAELRYELRRLVKSLKLTCIHATHDTNEAMITADRIAVFHKGKVVQIDAPSIIYNQPCNLFVANFVAESNLLEGIIVNQAENYSEVQLREDFIIKTQKINLAVGEKVVVVIRSESFELITDQTENIFPVTLKKIKFIGAFLRCIASLFNSKEIFIRLMPSEAKYISIDQKISLFVNKEECLVFPYPDEGLEEAIAP